MALVAFEHDVQSPESSSADRLRMSRPSFSQTKTSDRLRECDRRPTSSSSLSKPRRSVFREEGLNDLNHSVHPSHPVQNDRKRSISIAQKDDSDFREKNETFDYILRDIDCKDSSDEMKKARHTAWFSKLAKRPRTSSMASAPPGGFSTLPRTVLIAFLIAIVVPVFYHSSEDDKANINGADAEVIMRAELVENGSMIEGRADATSVCTRWAGQAANVNGSYYYYGGQTSVESGQTENTWNNDLVVLDLTKSWQIASPSISALPQPSGPPAVALGYLWHSYDSIFLYGGEFSDSPVTSPLPVSTWEYNIASGDWAEHANPKTSAGNYSEAGDIPVQRAAEGAGLSVPEIGRSWYFGGHLDLYTTSGWSNQIARVYLKSLLEFTHPGYANSGVESLGLMNAAPVGGVYRNITDGGIQADDGFTERADGVFVYVPGWGEQGIALGLAGGTNATMSEMNIIDIYDIANSTWYKQATSGTPPPIRVNPCAAVAAAPDRSSFNIYLYGGQNLIPYGSQIQMSDMYILTIPSFTWVQVDLEGQSAPPARAGHSCTMWDGQMVVMGGYVGTDISCDSPGVYVFNASSLEWTNYFTALVHPVSDSSSSSSSSDGSVSAQDSSVLQGSYGYQVPAAVQSIIGGSSHGGATATQPAVGSATAGPIGTGRPPTFTVTQSGSTVIQTAVSTSKPETSAEANAAKRKLTVPAIVAGVIAGAAGLLAAYLAFCTWLYRRQLNKYKDHVTIAQRTMFGSENSDTAWTANESAGAVRMSTKGSPAMLGPFGTVIGASGSESAESPSRDSSGAILSRDVTPLSQVISGSSSPPHYSGSMPNYMPQAKWGTYGRLSEEGEDTAYLGAASTVSGASTNSSVVDLTGGQEPSFFSVVLNPRRTLRVVNSD
ncbi:hypothetical protein BJ878DRAFT_570110 [Calycina marina]|uniref:Kelch repeat-containing protein n=1 Tax=Calycina marina TaxID=1763456 RepID=A0A9P8CC08_9HELO|nr:hypothetical protein BJ878DRAFT_570110 [Calycina marina]